MDWTMICDIVSHEGDLDHYVEAQMNVYIVYELCTTVEEKTRLLHVWDAFLNASHSVL